MDMSSRDPGIPGAGDGDHQSTTSKRIIRVGSRNSKLALIQTEFVISALTRIYGKEKYKFEVTSMTTTGDHILDKPLSQIGSKALFTKELEDALLSHEIDFIVHSLKDLPTCLPFGCSIGAILKREDPNDALVLKSGLNFDDPMDVITGKAKEGRVTIGTSSMRRIAQLKHQNPHVTVIDVRGNLNTRLAKLDSEASPYDALILACAGLTRGGFSSRISVPLVSDSWYYAVGQGALAIESRLGDQFITDFLQPLIDYETVFEALAERSLMLTLEGGCSVPIGVKCIWNRTGSGSGQKLNLTLSGAIFALDGVQNIQDSLSIDLDRIEPKENGDDDEHQNVTSTGVTLPKCPLLLTRYKNSVKLGCSLATRLREQGADDILKSIKNK